MRHSRVLAPAGSRSRSRRAATRSSDAPPPDAASRPLATASAAGDRDARRPKARPFDPGQLAVFAPLPEKIERPDNLLTDDKVALGKMLWFDARLSKGQDVSCNSCHDVTKSGADDAPHLDRHEEAEGHAQHADHLQRRWRSSRRAGTRARSLLEEFVVPHAAQPSVMGVDEKRLVETVASIPAYAAAFKKAFPDEKGAVTAETVSKAIGAYTRKLLTPARWDKFLGGDQSALTDDEKAGLGVFMDANCTTCHAGKYVGGAQNQKLGVAKAWPTSTRSSGASTSRSRRSTASSSRCRRLRNVTKTGALPPRRLDRDRSRST